MLLGTISLVIPFHHNVPLEEAFYRRIQKGCREPQANKHLSIRGMLHLAFPAQQPQPGRLLGTPTVTGVPENRNAKFMYAQLV